ncbi:hypothetical protein NMG60_11021652 [Bertholletia excelsa]
MADHMELKGSAHRIRKCAIELLAIGSDLMDDDDSWDLIGKHLQLKSAFLYCDFNKMISKAPQHQQKALTQLANKLFCSIEELDHATKEGNIPLTHDRYNEVAVVIQEVMAFIPALISGD